MSKILHGNINANNSRTLNHTWFLIRQGWNDNASKPLTHSIVISQKLIKPPKCLMETQSLISRMFIQIYIQEAVVIVLRIREGKSVFISGHAWVIDMWISNYESCARFSCIVKLFPSTSRLLFHALYLTLSIWSRYEIDKPLTSLPCAYSCRYAPAGKIVLCAFSKTAQKESRRQTCWCGCIGLHSHFI